jgi:hypothetical protein
MISLIAFGFTLYFLSDDENITPGDGVGVMFDVLILNYDVEIFNN